MKRIFITGGAGKIGAALRHGLKNQGFALYSCDVKDFKKVDQDETVQQLDILDIQSLKKAMQGIDCVIHLAGIPNEDTWKRILNVNIEGAYNVFEAARQAKVKRVIFGSSNHAIGFYRVEENIDATVAPRPDTYYGLSKVLGEALGRLYADKHGLSVCCLRIGSFEERPFSKRHLRTWISHRDLVQLVLKCIQAPSYHFAIVYGVSANSQNKWDNRKTSFLGYAPQDNAQNYISDCIQEDDVIADQFHGGSYCSQGFDGDSSAID